MTTEVLVVGLGGIGAFFASRLASVPGVRISAICRSNYSSVNGHGFQVISPDYGTHTTQLWRTYASANEAKAAAQSEGLGWDYLLVATKVLSEHGDPGILLDGLVSERSSIVLMQNGLGIEEPYRVRFTQTPILTSVTQTSMQQLKPNIFEHCHWTETSIGPYGCEGQDASVEAYQSSFKFADMLRQSGIHHVAKFDHFDMQFARWHKTAINAAMNPTSVLSGGPANSAMAFDCEIRQHQEGVMNEILSVAVAILGRPVPDVLPKIDAVLTGASQDVSGSYPSMWHDWRAGRLVEVEAILGNPLRRARKVDLETPRVQSLYAMLKMLQSLREASHK